MRRWFGGPRVRYQALIRPVRQYDSYGNAFMIGVPAAWEDVDPVDAEVVAWLAAPRVGGPAPNFKALYVVNENDIYQRLRVGGMDDVYRAFALYSEIHGPRSVEVGGKHGYEFLLRQISSVAYGADNGQVDATITTTFVRHADRTIQFMLLSETLYHHNYVAGYQTMLGTLTWG